MEKTFFQQLAALKVSGNIRINIQQQADERILVSVLLTNDDLMDKAAQRIPPMLLKGSPAELDEGFMAAITKPIQRTNGLFSNMIDYEKSVELAKKESRSEKDKEDLTKRAKEGRKKKFDEQMKKVEELDKFKKYGEAIGQVPDLKHYPEFETEIKTRLQQLRSKHGSLSLFEEAAQTMPAEESRENENNDDDNSNNSDEFDENDGNYNNDAEDNSNDI